MEIIMPFFAVDIERVKNKLLWAYLGQKKGMA